MSEIEKMKRYIARTNMDLKSSSSYQMGTSEAFELAMQARESKDIPLAVISLAFHYGQAKGYRAAKAEVRA